MLKKNDGCHSLLRRILSLLLIVFILSPSVAEFSFAAPSTDYIRPVNVEMNEDNGSSFDLKDLLGPAYTDGGLLPDYLSSEIGYCEVYDTTAENDCASGESFTIPPDTTAIRITGYGTNSDGALNARNDDYIQMTTTLDLDPNSSGFNTYSGFISFPFDIVTQPVYGFSGVPLGSASDTAVAATGSPTGDNITESMTVSVSGSTLTISQTQTLVNTAFLVEYLSSVSNSSILRGIESIVLEADGLASPGTGSLNVLPQDTLPTHMLFNDDGTTLYTAGRTNDDVYEYELTTPYDVSTAAYIGVALDVSSESPNPYSMLFNNDGTKFYLLDYNSDAIFAYPLTTAYDISTAGAPVNEFDFSANSTTPMDIIYNGDGTSVFISNYGTDEIHQYNLGTAYDMSSAVFDSIVMDVGMTSNDPRAINFNSTGTEFYIVSVATDTLDRYTLTTPYDLTTASFDTVVTGLADGVVESFVFLPGETQFYTLGYTTDVVQLYEYDNVIGGPNTNMGSVPIPIGTDYAVITELAGRPDTNSRGEAKLVTRMVAEFQPLRDEYSKVHGVVTSVIGSGEDYSTTYAFEDLDSAFPTAGGTLGAGSEANTVGDIVASDAALHTPDVYISGGNLFIERSAAISSKAGSDFFVDYGGFTSQYTVEFYERAETASAAQFLGSSADKVDLEGSEDTRTSCDPDTAPENCLDLAIPSGASLGLMIMASNNNGGDGTNENWGTMSAIVEIDKEVSPGVYENKVSGGWAQTRASSPDFAAWTNLDFDTPLFDWDNPVPAQTTPNPGVTSNKDIYSDGIGSISTGSSSTGLVELTDAFVGATEFTRLDVDGVDTLRVHLNQGDGNGGTSYRQNNFVASIQWFGPEPLIFTNVPDEFGFTSPALDLGSGTWQLGANAVINGTINIDPPAGYNNDGGVTAQGSIAVARASNPGDTASVNVNVIPVTDLMELDDIDPNETNPPGNTVSEILSTSNSSPAANDSGIAITGFSIDTGVGTWEFSLDGGGTWSPLAGLSPLNALLLGPTDRLRVVPAGESMTGEIDFVSWDMSAHSAGAVLNPAIGPTDDFTLFGTTGDTATIQTISAPGATDAQLLVWYKADDGPSTITDGAAISRWVDIGTNGEDAFAVSGREPVYKKFGPDNNYQPTAVFKNSGMGTLNSSLLGGTNAYTKLAVITPSSVVGNQTIFGTEAGGDHRMQIEAPRVELDHNGAGFAGEAVVAGETALVAVRYKSGGAVDNFVRVNGVSAVNNAAYPFSDGSTITLGHDSLTNFFDGNISEAIAYDEQVADQNLAQIESYLALKYGLTIVPDYVDSSGNLVYPASTTTYNNGIIGLARDDATALDQRVAHSQQNDAILSIATNNNFLLANNDINRTKLANATYVVGGHDGGAITFGADYDGNSGERMTRIWQFEETLETGDVTFAIPSSTIFPAGIPVLVQSTDTTFDAFDAGSELVDDGSFFTGTVDITDGAYFSFAVENPPAPIDVKRQTPMTQETNDTSVIFEVTFSEDVQNVDVTDFTTIKTGTVTGDVLSVTQVSGSVYNISITNVTGNGTLGLAINAATDINDNFNIGLNTNIPTGDNEQYDVDTVAPAGPTVSSPTVGGTVSSPTPIVGSCSGAEGGTVSITTAPGGGIVPDPTVGVVDALGEFSVNVVWNGASNGNTYDLIAACTDSAGNTSINTIVSGITPDLTGPQAQIEQSGIQPDPTNALAAQFILTFSEPINGATIAPTDFDLSGSTAPAPTVNSVSELSPLDGTTFKLTITTTGDGEVMVKLPGGMVEDVAGNSNAGSLSVDNTVTIDTTPPAAPNVSAPLPGATVNSPTGVDIECNEAGEVITIINPNLTPNPTTYTCTGAGVQTVPVSWLPGTTGNQALDVTLTDPAGNVSPTTSVSVIVDLEDPGVTLNQSTAQSDPANSYPIVWTINFSEVIDVTSFTASDLAVSVNSVSVPVGTLVQVAPNDGTTFEYQITGGLVTGDEVTISLPLGSVQDLSGNNNTVSVSGDNTIAFDNTPPAVPVVSSPLDGQAAGNPTTVTGACEPGALVMIDNPNIQGSPVTTICDPSGNFSQDVLWNPGTSGLQDIEVYQTDAAGNVSPTDTVTAVEVDLDPPSNPTITFPDPSLAPNGSTDGTISGIGTPGDTIEVVLSPGGQTCTAIVQPDGTWTCEVAPALVSPDDEGPLLVTAVAYDPAGNASGPDSVFAQGDVTQPSGTTVDSPEAGDTVNNPTVVTGLCEAGSTVTISNPNIIPDPTVTICNPDGTYSTPVLWDVAAHGTPQTLSVTETDGAGNTSVPVTQNVEVDLSPAITGPSPLQGTVGQLTTVSGTCEPGGTVTLTGNFTPDPNIVTCDSNGMFSAPVVPTASGPVDITVTQTDGTGSSFPGAPDNQGVFTMVVNEPSTDDNDPTPASVENSGFNGGDGDGDGQPDSIQGNVSTAPNIVTGNSSTLVTNGSSCRTITGNAFISEGTLQVQDPTADYPLGLVDFTVECGSPGLSADITIYYTEEYDTSNWTYKKYSASGQAYSNIDDLVTYGTANVGGKMVTTVSYRVTDGDPRTDEDGIANGVIHDPSGPSIPQQVVTRIGGAVTQNYTIAIRDPNSGSCVNMIVNQGVSRTNTYANYQSCLRSSATVSGIQCAESWAVENGFQLCSPTPSSTFARTPVNETIADAYRETVPTNVVTETPEIRAPGTTVRTVDGYQVLEIPIVRVPLVSPTKRVSEWGQEEPLKASAPSCTEVQYDRFPENRGDGVQSMLFEDVDPAHLDYASLIDLAEQKIVSGDSDTGYARLDDGITRSEAVKIMTIAREDLLKQGTCVDLTNFPDVNTAAWYHDFVQNMEQQNIVHGYDDGMYRPGKRIIKAELYKILAIGFGFISKDEASAKAASNNQLWFEPYIQVLDSNVDLPARLKNAPVDKTMTRGDVFTALSYTLKKVDKQ